MATIQGPIGTGQQFQNSVTKFQNKGKTNLQARRITAGGGIENDLRKKKRKKVKKNVKKM